MTDNNTLKNCTAVLFKYLQPALQAYRIQVICHANQINCYYMRGTLAPSRIRIHFASAYI